MTFGEADEDAHGMELVISVESKEFSRLYSERESLTSSVQFDEKNEISELEV